MEPDKSYVDILLVETSWAFLTWPGTRATSCRATICEPNNTPDTSFRSVIWH